MTMGAMKDNIKRAVAVAGIVTNVNSATNPPKPLTQQYADQAKVRMEKNPRGNTGRQSPGSSKR